MLISDKNIDFFTKHNMIISVKYHSIKLIREGIIVYLDCKVEIPIELGIIIRFRKRNTIYICYVAGRTYNPEKKYNVPDHKTIGSLVSKESSLMIPNENFLRYFADVELPETKKRKNAAAVCVSVHF